MRLLRSLSRLRAGGDQRLQHARHMVDRGAERRAVADEIVGALGARIERRARNGENLPSLLQGETRGDERARAPRRLDHHHPVGQARDDAVAARKIAPARLPAHGHFRDHRAAILDDGAQQRLVLRRIDPVVAAGEHRDGPARQRRLVGSGIDAAGKAGHDHITGLARAAATVAPRRSARRRTRCANPPWRRTGCDNLGRTAYARSEAARYRWPAASSG